MPEQFLKIESCGPVEIDCKRANLPFTLRSTCKCGEEVVVDLADDQYLSYPVVGGEDELCKMEGLEPEKVHFYCQECDSEWSFRVRLAMTMTVVP